MKITRQSPVSGKIRTMDKPIKTEDYIKWHSGKGLIQNCMPYLTDDEREFIMTGITPEEWDEVFPEEED